MMSSIVWDFRVPEADDEIEAERREMEQQIAEADDAAYVRILGYVPGRET